MTALPRSSAHPSPLLLHTGTLRTVTASGSPCCCEPCLTAPPPQQPLRLWVGSQLVQHVTAATNLAPQLALHPSFHGGFPPASLKSL